MLRGDLLERPADQRLVHTGSSAATARLDAVPLVAVESRPVLVFVAELALPGATCNRAGAMICRSPAPSLAVCPCWGTSICQEVGTLRSPRPGDWIGNV